MPKIRIKEVTQKRDKCFASIDKRLGEYVILVSEKKIRKDPSVYLETLLHEFLHFIVTRMRKKFGIKLDNVQEHIIIGRIESAVLRTLANYAIGKRND